MQEELDPILEQLLGFTTAKDGERLGMSTLREKVGQISDLIKSSNQLAEPHPDCVTALNAYSETLDEFELAQKLIDIIQLHHEAGFVGNSPDYWDEVLPTF